MSCTPRSDVIKPYKGKMKLTDNDFISDIFIKIFEKKVDTPNKKKIKAPKTRIQEKCFEYNHLLCILSYCLGSRRGWGEC